MSCPTVLDTAARPAFSACCSVAVQVLSGSQDEKPGPNDSAGMCPPWACALSLNQLLPCEPSMLAPDAAVDMEPCGLAMRAWVSQFLTSVSLFAP